MDFERRIIISRQNIKVEKTFAVIKDRPRCIADEDDASLSMQICFREIKRRYYHG